MPHRTEHNDLSTMEDVKADTESTSAFDSENTLHSQIKSKQSPRSKRNIKLAMTHETNRPDETELPLLPSTQTSSTENEPRKIGSKFKEICRLDV